LSEFVRTSDNVRRYSDKRSPSHLKFCVLRDGRNHARLTLMWLYSSAAYPERRL
jgi:hypothetical protein